MATNLSPKQHKKGTRWSPKSGIKTGTEVHILEIKDGPKKGKWRIKTKYDTKIPRHGNDMVAQPEPEPNTEPEGMSKDDDWWAITPEPKGHWTNKDTWTEPPGPPVDWSPQSTPTWMPGGTWETKDKWTETTPSWDSSEWMAEPEDMKWTENSALWDHMNFGGTWDNDNDKWTGAEPEPEGKLKDDGKWTAPEPEPEDLKWTKTTPNWDMSVSSPGPEGKWKDDDKWTGPEPETEGKWIKAKTWIRCLTIKADFLNVTSSACVKF